LRGAVIAEVEHHDIPILAIAHPLEVQGPVARIVIAMEDNERAARIGGREEPAFNSGLGRLNSLNREGFKFAGRRVGGGEWG
jgi:hypothetical protein